MAVDKRGISHIAIWSLLISGIPVFSWLVSPHIVLAEEFDHFKNTVTVMQQDISKNTKSIENIYIGNIRRDLRDLNLRIARLEAKDTLEQYEREELSLLKSSRASLMHEIRATNDI